MVTFIGFSSKFAGFSQFPRTSTLSVLVRKKDNQLKRKRIISHNSEIQHTSRRDHNAESRVILWPLRGLPHSQKGPEPQLPRIKLQKHGAWGAGVLGYTQRPRRLQPIRTQMVGGGVGLGDRACRYTLTVITPWGSSWAFLCRLNDWLLKQSRQLYICWFGHSDAENPRLTVFPPTHGAYVSGIPTKIHQLKEENGTIWLGGCSWRCGWYCFL